MTVTVIGLDRQGLPPGAGSVLAQARLVVGPRHLLERHVPPDRATLDSSGGLPVDDIAVAEGPTAVLVAGDAGYFGDLRALRARKLDVVAWPSVTDVQRMAALVKRPWDDIAVVSARGRDFRHAVNVCRARKAVAVLTAPGAGPAELARELDGWRRNIAVLEHVGSPGERLSILDVSEAERRVWREPNLVLCLASLDSIGQDGWIAGGDPVPPVGGWALEDSAFATRTGVGLAPEVRALVLARLAPRPGALVWDVCAGSGAVGIEAARLGAAVIAVERDSGLCVRIVANAGAHGVDVRLADGEPTRVLGSLPRPDSVFVGSSQPEVVRACAAAGAERVVVLVPEPDRLGGTRRALADAGYAVRGCQLSVAELLALPDDTTGLQPSTATFLLWGTRA
ncbi:Cobalt-precorrin-6y C5-methyltransferase [Actinokineospora spheciospongiae]|uniref:Cobalt-precorrin-6y C5-methyltransferase n=1 Tax=Actinokineospora spheciospongiae TaxID=909613 RepID=W7IQJ0_9PSEU|nr:bifunctional cobalt-precorrin-7 (C(5))-methyltransferase CbiE/decarboxylating cobalt-precorrin-6B (C(15))-methyltransferase CbiT [Actinokineospora spheciospongiae]EWC62653.1 Cobalt-precorrin-6y C5-methyltransferase [Actinokineospora spheciospongiae]